MKPRVLCLSMLLLLASCAGTGEVPSAPAASDSRVPAPAMSYAEAYGALKEAMVLSFEIAEDRRYRVDESAIELISGTASSRFRFRDTPDPEMFTCGRFSDCAGEVRVRVKGTGPYAGPRCCVWRWMQSRKAAAERFFLAFRVLAAGVPAESPQEIERFRAVVAQFHAANPKPEFPEAARRFRVQAESAFSEKRIDDAASLYGKALDAAPWWPQGRFNHALMLGELGRYTEATREMKKYLALVPNAPNARAARDKIYEWEDKAGRI